MTVIYYNDEGFPGSSGSLFTGFRWSYYDCWEYMIKCNAHVTGYHHFPLKNHQRTGKKTIPKLDSPKTDGFAQERVQDSSESKTFKPCNSRRNLTILGILRGQG